MMHAIGIPLILLGAMTALSSVQLFTVIGVIVDLGWMFAIALTVYYISLDMRLGLAMGGALVFLHLIGGSILGRSVTVGIVLFVLGWVLQFVGHHFEGNRPAFLKNGIHLLIGPMWIIHRLFHHLGIDDPQSAR